MSTATFDPGVLDELRQSVRGVSARATAARDPRSAVWEPDPVDEWLWKQAGDLGWTSLLVAEQWGGAGAGLTETLVVVEELAASLAVLPYLPSAVLTVSALELAGNDEQRGRWLPDLSAGATRGAAALTGPTGRTGIDLIDVLAHEHEGGWELRGRAGFVVDAADADLLVVAARTGNHASFFVVDPADSRVTVAEDLAVDRTRRMARIELDGIVVAHDARLAGDGDAALTAVVLRGSLAVAADACGAGRRSLELALEYAKHREQFDRPIGSFQAIKHKLADMYVLMQGAQLAVAAAARAIDRGERAATRLVEVACAYARDAATAVTGDAIQVHGGIGYTWEHDCHRLWKRAKFDEMFLGDPTVHRAALAAVLLDSVS